METNAGQQYVRQATVPGQPDAAIQQLTTALTGVPGYTLMPTGPTAISLSRKFLPQWALIGGIIAGLLTCVGFLLLLYKEEETLTVTATGAGGQTRLDFAGAASPAMVTRLTGAINQLGGEVAAAAPGFAPPAAAPAAAAPAAPAPPPPPAPPAAATAAGAWHPDPSGRHEQRYWDGNAWTDHVMDGGTPGSDPAPTS